MKTLTLKAVEYDLPAYWASYLINGDHSGISALEKLQVDRFISLRRLPLPVGATEEPRFGSNDSDDCRLGDVLTFTFLV